MKFKYLIFGFYLGLSCVRVVSFAKFAQPFYDFEENYSGLPQILWFLLPRNGETLFMSIKIFICNVSCTAFFLPLDDHGFTVWVFENV